MTGARIMREAKARKFCKKPLRFGAKLRKMTFVGAMQRNANSNAPTVHTSAQVSNTMNVQVDTKTNELVIKLPLSQPRPSATGKTLVVAASGGSIPTGAVINGKPVTVSCTCWIKP